MPEILLLLRLSVFLFFILAVVYVVWNWVRNDRRQKWAVTAGVGVAFATLLCLIIDIIVGADKQAAFRLLMLPSIAILGVAIWLSCYAGMVLWDKNGGYWVRNKAWEQRSRTLVSCALVTIGLVVWPALVCRLFSVPHLATTWGSPMATVSNLFRQLAYSSAEEIFYRGWVQGILTIYLVKFRWGNVTALLIASIVFAVQHVGGPYQLPVLIVALGGGVAFGLVFRRFGLVAAMCTHSATNLLLAVV